MNIIEKIVFLIGWIKIVFSPFAIGVILGFLTYKYFPGTAGIICGLVLAFSGLIIGIIWAEYIRKKYGSMNFLGKVNGSPELDNPEEKRNKIHQ